MKRKMQQKMTQFDLSRFYKAQERDYEIALSEILAGRKQSHWMWYIFPQLKGLGHSGMADYYGINGLDEAAAYLADPVLREHLVRISSALLTLETSDPKEVMGSPDDLKLKSCMTLFAAADPDEKVFTKVLEKYYGGETDKRTEMMLKH